MPVSDVIRVPVKPREACPVCKKENCEVRITRHPIPTPRDLQATLKYRYEDLKGGAK